MNLKSCLVLLSLIETLSASYTKHDTPKFTYQSLVLRIKKECSCNDWHDGVLKYYEGTTETAKQYPGPTNQAEPVMTAFGLYLNKLLDLSSSNSTILSSSSTAVLDAMSKLSKMSGSYGNLLNEATNRLPQLSIDLQQIVSSLSDNIGEMIVVNTNNVITDLVQSILHFAHMFRKCGVEHFGNGLGATLNYEPITKHTQVLMNVIALIAETTINECIVATPKILESLTVLALISNYYFIGAHSINVVAQAVLHQASQLIPDELYFSLITMSPLLQPLTQIIDVIDDASEVSIVQVSTRLVSFTMSLNAKLNKLFGPFNGVATNVWQITKSLETSVSKMR